MTQAGAAAVTTGQLFATLADRCVSGVVGTSSFVPLLRMGTVLFMALTALLSVALAAAAESRFAEKYLVILTQGGQLAVSSDVVQRLPVDRDTAVLSSSDFANLKPCLTVTVAHAFAEKPAAVKYLANLKKKGLEGYLKRSGRYVPNDAKRARHCELQRTRQASAETPRFVYVAGAQTFVRLDGLAEVKVRDDEQVYNLARAPLQGDPSGALKKGARFDLLDGFGGTTECVVDGFEALLREEPGGSFDADGPAVPSPFHTPRCGTIEPWARVQCASPVAVPAVAVPHGQGADVYRMVEQPDLEARTRKRFQASAEVLEARREGTRAATQSHPFSFSDSVRTLRATQGQGAVVVWSGLAITGEGNDQCGNDSFHREPMVAFFFTRPDADPVVIYRASDERARAAGAFQLLSDGDITLMLDSPNGPQLISGGRVIANDVIAFCGCGC